jgi:hypothetical protein
MRPAEHSVFVVDDLADVLDGSTVLLRAGGAFVRRARYSTPSVPGSAK